MAPAVMQLLVAPDLALILRSFVVLPSYMVLCGTCRLPGTSVPDQLARLRQAHTTYNYVVQSAQAALLHGVFCPGIDRQTGGVMFLDAERCTLQMRVMRELGLLPFDARPLQPLVQEYSGCPMAAWHIVNSATPAWMCLSTLLRDDRTTPDFTYYCTPSGRRCFVVELLLDTFRCALVFERDPAAVIQVD